METKRKFSLKRLFKTLFCEHEFEYKCSNGCGKTIIDYYECRYCWKFITIKRPDFIGDLLEEVKELIKN